VSGTDKLSAALQIAERVYSLAQGQDDPALMIGAYYALASTLYFLGDFESARQYARHGLQIWRSGGVKSHPETVDTPVVGCFCHGAMSEWNLGEIASCQANMDEVISLAKELKNMTAIVRQNLRRDSYLNAGSLKVAIAGEKVKRNGQMDLSKIRSKAQGLIYGRVTQGASLWRRIDPIYGRDSRERSRSCNTRARIYDPSGSLLPVN
jgi:hypothetical protein